MQDNECSITLPLLYIRSDKLMMINSFVCAQSSSYTPVVKVNTET